jgi:hypothetical protein
LYYTILHNAEHNTTFRIHPQVGKLALIMWMDHILTTIKDEQV